MLQQAVTQKCITWSTLTHNTIISHLHYARVHICYCTTLDYGMYMNKQFSKPVQTVYKVKVGGAHEFMRRTCGSHADGYLPQEGSRVRPAGEPRSRWTSSWSSHYMYRTCTRTCDKGHVAWVRLGTRWDGLVLKTQPIYKTMTLHVRCLGLD